MKIFVQLIFAFFLFAFCQCQRVSKRISTIQCTTYQWRCDDGQCINSYDQCDGVVHCNDGSDETAENCIASECPSYAFRCAYGGCVSKNAECNRKIECRDGSDENTQKCPMKPENQLHGNCQRTKFQCESGECIDSAHLCDGKADCSDGSDEMVTYCAAQPCPAFAFRCGNGACITGKKKCNFVVDCYDGSDENDILCGRNGTESQSRPVSGGVVTSRPTGFGNQNNNNYNEYGTTSRPTYSNGGTGTTRPPYGNGNQNSYNFNTNNNNDAYGSPAGPSTSSSTSKCRADNIPVNGDAYHAFDPNKKVAYGELIDNYGSINYTCIENHYLIGNTTNFCLNGQWSASKPQCKAKCSSTEIQGVTIAANCYSIVNNTQVSTSCVRPVEPGTLAYVSCQRGYEKTGPQQTLTCRTDGRWTPTPIRCTQICGEINEGTAYVVGGTETNVSRIPWQAAIYKRNSPDTKYLQICGGTIISPKIVLSAMHCFWDRSENVPHDKDAFNVVVGKTIRDYAAQDEYKPQFFGVEDILFIDGYNDFAGNYANDIALIVLDKYVEFHSYIVPICLPHNLHYEEKTVPVGWIGITGGWGLTKNNGRPSEILKKIELPVVSREECRANSSPEFASFITSDKFCAGYLTGASVCQGDSGGGLVFPKTIGSKTQYTIRGIVSVGGNKAGSCDNDKFTTFTNVAFYMDFINAHVSRYEPKF